jgi:hypothetical protein
MSDQVSVLAQMAHIVATAPQQEALPARLCRAYVEVLGADGGAVTLASTTRDRLTVSRSDGLSQQIEDLQDVLGEGPGQDAYREGRAVVATVDGARATSFPMFSEMVGVITRPLTVWAVPMHPGGMTIGVITVYRRAGGLSCSVHDAQLLADSIGAALLDDPVAAGLTPLAGWSDRSRVHQATGMVVAQLGMAPDDALAILRAHAFAEGTSLDVIATRVVDRRLSFVPTDTGVGSTKSSEDGER